MHLTTVQDLRNSRRAGATSLRLHLDERNASDPELSKALAACHTLRKLELPLQPFFVVEPHWQQVPTLFAAMGALPQLQSLTIKARTLTGNPFPIGFLESVLIPGRHRLRYLHLDLQRIQCSSARQVKRVALALQQQTSLEWIKLKYNKLLINTNTAATEIVDFRAIDPILSSMGRIPTLQHVQIVGTSEGEDDEFALEVEDEELPTLESACLKDLLSDSSSLVELRLEWMALSVDNIVTLSNSLAVDTVCLQKLVLGLFPEQDKAFEAFTNLLCRNSSLEVIHLHTSWKTLSDWPAVFTPAKEASQSLQKFLVRIARSLPQNQHLKEFHLCGPTIQEIPPRAEKALARALQPNLVLTSLRIGTQSSQEGDLCDSLEYYLKLNRLNRKYFVQRYEQVTTEEWIQLLAKTSRDLNSMFYFLRLNPFLCQVNGVCSKAKTKTTTVRAQSQLTINNDQGQSTTALTQAVATIIDNVVSTMEVELRYQDRLEKEVKRLRQEIALLKRQQR